MQYYIKGNERNCSIMLKVSHGLFLAYSLLAQIPAFSTPLKLGTYVAIALLLVNFFLQYQFYTFKEISVYIAAVIISLIHSFFSANFGFFKLMLFAGSIRRIDLRKLIRFDMYLRSFLIIAVIFFCKIGVAENVSFDYEGIVRQSMGFTSPNALGIAIFVLVCDILYLNHMKLNGKLFTIIAAISVWLYAVARCRTAVYCIVFLMVLAFIYRASSRMIRSRFVIFICHIAPIALSLLTLVAVRMYASGSGTIREINDFLSGRIHAIYRFTYRLTPQFFGQPINETVKHSLDNTYGFIWYDLGILVFLIFLYANYKMVKNNVKANNMSMCLIMLAFMFYGLSEHLWINVDYNVFMLAFCYNPLKTFVTVVVDDDAIVENGTIKENPEANSKSATKKLII